MKVLSDTQNKWQPLILQMLPVCADDVCINSASKIKSKLFPLIIKYWCNA